MLLVKSGNLLRPMIALAIAQTRHLIEARSPVVAAIESPSMETINGCTVIRSTETPEPISFGPAETNASYVVEVGLFAPGTALPPHLHPNTDEVFYVGDGEATFQLGDRELQLGAGAFVFVPRGTTHAVRNSGDGPIRGLIVISPGDAEHEFVPVEPS
jgi:quercetin dioxygenase-like cupin family protein